MSESQAHSVSDGADHADAGFPIRCGPAHPLVFTGAGVHGGTVMASVGLLLLGDAFHSNYLPQLVLALILLWGGGGASLEG